MTKFECVEKGRALFRNGIQSLVDTAANINKTVAIDVNTGEFWVGASPKEAAQWSRCRGKDNVWQTRIGYTEPDTPTILIPIHQLIRQLDVDKPEAHPTDKSSGWTERSSEWLMSHKQSDDELWYFDNGKENWDKYMGRAGYALVRSLDREGVVLRVVVDFIVTRLN